MRAQDKNSATRPISLLDNIRKNGRPWRDLSRQYGVENPDPPWKVSLEGMCDALDEGRCALPGLERRQEEDAFVENLYTDVPFPESQLLALAHSLIARGLLSEDELAQKIRQIDRRFHSADKQKTG